MDCRREAGDAAGGSKAGVRKRVALFNGAVRRARRYVSARCRTNGSRTTQEAATAAGQESHRGHRAVSAADARRQLGGLAPDRPARLSDLPPDRHTRFRRWKRRSRRSPPATTAKAVPFVGATDETGGLARSIDVLKQGAAAMDEQRWVKSNVSRLTGELQGAASLAEFGATAAFGSRADAGRRRRGFLCVRRNARASAPRVHVRPRRHLRLRQLDPAR